MAYELLSQSSKLNKRGGPNKSGRVGKFFEKKNLISVGTFIRDSRVSGARNLLYRRKMLLQTKINCKILHPILNPVSTHQLIQIENLGFLRCKNYFFKHVVYLFCKVFDHVILFRMPFKCFSRFRTR